MQDERGGGLDRFATPLYSVTEAARYLDVPASTFATWTHGYRRRPAGRREVVGGPVLTALPRSGVRAPIILFIGLAEGLVLAAMRRSGVPLQRIRPALERLEEESGLAHALASQRLYTDGAEVLFDYAESADDPTAARAARELVCKPWPRSTEFPPTRPLLILSGWPRCRFSASTVEICGPPRWHSGSSTCSTRSPKPAANRDRFSTRSPASAFAGCHSTVD